MVPGNAATGVATPSLLRVLPWILAGLLMAPSLVWICRDQAVWSFDPAWYGEIAVELWYALARDFEDWPAAMRYAFRIKAPGVAWLGQFFVPLGESIGSVEVGLLLSLLLCQLLTLVVTFRFIREWLPDSPLVAVFATVATASAPLFIALSHLFFAEGLQLLAITWLFWLAAAAPRLSRARLTAHLVLALSVAMLGKASSPLYLFLPLLLILHSWFRAKAWLSPEDRRARIYALLVLGTVVLTACLAWYASNLKEVSHFVRYAASSAGYGRAGPLLGKLAYWLHALRSNFFYPWAALAIAALILIGIALRFALRNRLGPVTLQGHRPILASACLLQIVAVLVAFSLNVNDDQRYLLPLLPSLVGFVSWALASSRSRVVVAAALSLVTVQFALANAQALGMRERDPKVTYWLIPYQPSPLQRSELLQIVRVANDGDAAERYCIVGVDLQWLNGNSLSFLAAQEKLRAHERSHFTSLGHMADDPGAAWNRLQSLRTSYFVSLTPERLPAADVFNEVSRPILERVAADPCFVKEDFASQLGVVVYRRSCEWAP